MIVSTSISILAAKENQGVYHKIKCLLSWELIILPGTQVEAMYDNNVYARNKGIWVTIEQ